MEIRVLSWNLYHGRDGPPDPALYTKRSKWLRLTERNETHVQVNRDLYREFSALLAGAGWDVALLQECPPRWTRPLARDCGAEVHRSLTSRNWLLPLTSLLARANPDLIGSSEGGSNAILARPSAGGMVERRSLTVRRLWPERRTMAFARFGVGLCVTCLHASTRDRLAEAEILVAARQAVEWAGEEPLVFGGDFNIRPYKSPLFDELERRHGLTGLTARDAIDHLLVRDLEIVDPARPWPAEARELREDHLALRLSDHAPVEITVRISAAGA